MNYELAEKLKDAGFPQGETYSGGHWIPAPHHVEDENTEYVIDPIQGKIPKWMYEVSVWAPSLSELIEACGDEFSELHKKHINPVFHAKTMHEFKEDWYCTGGQDGEIFSEGLTPEEAVANLWLALNQSEKPDPNYPIEDDFSGASDELGYANDR